MEVQEDESEIQNNVLRRLYRILTRPVPDMIDEKELAAKGLTAGAGKLLRRKTTVSNKVMPAETEHLDSATRTDTETVKEEAKKTDKKDKKGLYSVLQKSLFHPSQRIRDILMSITNICEECQLSNFA